MRAAFALLLIASTAHAGGWTHEPGHFYLQLGTAFSYANERYTADGSTAPITVQKNMGDAGTLSLSNYQQMLTDLYFEVGVFKRVTVFGDLPFISARQLNPGGNITYSSNNMGDILVGLRGAALLDPVALALEARFTAPSGNSKSPLPTGSGDFRAELRLVLSKSFDRVPIYLDFETGLMLRGSGRVYDPFSTAPDSTSLVNFSPQVTVHAEVGGTLIRWKKVDRLMLVVNVDFVGSTRKSDVTLATLALYPENSEMTTVTFTLASVIWRGLGVMVRAAPVVEGLQLPVLRTFGGAVFASW